MRAAQAEERRLAKQRDRILQKRKGRKRKPRKRKKHETPRERELRRGEEILRKNEEALERKQNVLERKIQGAKFVQERLEAWWNESQMEMAEQDWLSEKRLAQFTPEQYERLRQAEISGYFHEVAQDIAEELDEGVHDVFEHWLSPKV